MVFIIVVCCSLAQASHQVKSAAQVVKALEQKLRDTKS